MIKLNKITYFILFSMLFWPVLSYITYGVLGLKSINVYYSAISILFGLFFIFHRKKIYKKIHISRELLYYSFFILYIFLWSYFNGSISRRGLVPVILNNQYLASYFIVLIIYNTKFTDHFIENSIKIFKITIILATIVSVIQVFDSKFFNAFFYEQRELDVYRKGLYQTRRASIFGFINLNSLGLSFIPIVGILIGYLLRQRNKKYIVYLLLSCLPAFLSNTRYVMISFIIITIQIIIYRKDSLVGFFKYVLFAIIFFLFIFILFDFMGYDLGIWYKDRLFAEGSLQHTTRYKALINFIKFFPDNFLIGNGELLNKDVVTASLAYGSSHIHIGYLSHLVAYGTFGCFLLYGFWYILLKKLYKTAKLTNYWGSFFGFITFLWAFVTFSHSSIFLYGILFTLIFDKYYFDQYKQKKLNIDLKRKKETIMQNIVQIPA